MQEKDFPALYRSANDFSAESQNHFFRGLRVHLISLVVAAVCSILTFDGWGTEIAMLQLAVLLLALGCSIYMFGVKPDRHWYGARAVAESIKTITWRYVTRAEPFNIVDKDARTLFIKKLTAIVKQNHEVSQRLIRHLNASQITPVMEDLRAKDLYQRRVNYFDNRITDQLNWYSAKAEFNRSSSKKFFWTLIGLNVMAVVLAICRIKYPLVSIWPTDVIVAGAASLLSWMQARRHSELAASYALTAHEIGLISNQASQIMSENDFSVFVGDAENAFSREHTQWVARMDV